jgi:hypothetical protein
MTSFLLLLLLYDYMADYRMHDMMHGSAVKLTLFQAVRESKELLLLLSNSLLPLFAL